MAEPDSQPALPLDPPPAPPLDAVDVDEPSLLHEAPSASNAPQERRPRIKKMEVIVAEVIRETPDSSTLVFFTGNDKLEYQAGHFLTIAPQQFPALDRFCKYFEDVKGKREPARAYSMCSAPHEKYLAVTVKEELYISGETKYPPLMSPFLTYRIQPGTRMVVTGFGGPYVLPADVEARTDHIVHVCAGSGIVPNMSILRHCLENGMKLRHTLIYGNKTWEDIIFQRQIAELEKRFPEQLKVVHAISRDPEAVRRGPNVRTGRISEALLREHVPDPTAVEVFTCGPGITKWDRLAAKEKGQEATPRFLETALAALATIGVPTERVHHESYG